MDATAYPWFRTVQGPEIEQGDILDGCPIFLPPDDLELDDGAMAPVVFRWEVRDVLVMTQSCDLVPGREKVSEVLLCPVWNRSELTTGHLATPRGLEDARRGNLPGLHLLAPSDLEGFRRDVRIVDFRQVHALPLSFVRRRADRGGDRLRLLPPYREHLSQAFARYFMRVGLPVDIAPFR